MVVNIDRVDLLAAVTQSVSKRFEMFRIVSKVRRAWLDFGKMPKSRDAYAPRPN